jgi:hypothetical protein
MHRHWLYGPSIPLEGMKYLLQQAGVPLVRAEAAAAAAAAARKLGIDQKRAEWEQKRKQAEADGEEIPEAPVDEVQEEEDGGEIDAKAAAAAAAGEEEEESDGTEEQQTWRSSDEKFVRSLTSGAAPLVFKFHSGLPLHGGPPASSTTEPYTGGSTVLSCVPGETAMAISVLGHSSPAASAASMLNGVAVAPALPKPLIVRVQMNPFRQVCGVILGLCVICD